MEEDNEKIIMNSEECNGNIKYNISCEPYVSLHDVCKFLENKFMKFTILIHIGDNYEEFYFIKGKVDYNIIPNVFVVGGEGMICQFEDTYKFCLISYDKALVELLYNINGYIKSLSSRIDKLDYALSFDTDNSLLKATKKQFTEVQKDLNKKIEKLELLENISGLGLGTKDRNNWYIKKL